MSIAIEHEFWQEATELSAHYGNRIFWGAVLYQNLLALFWDLENSQNLLLELTWNSLERTFVERATAVSWLDQSLLAAFTCRIVLWISAAKVVRAQSFY